MSVGAEEDGANMQKGPCARCKSLATTVAQTVNILSKLYLYTAETSMLLVLILASFITSMLCTYFSM